MGETELGAEKWIMESQILKDQLVLKEEQLKNYQEELKKAYSKTKKQNVSIYFSVNMFPYLELEATWRWLVLV